jgi:arylsulfatase
MKRILFIAQTIGIALVTTLVMAQQDKGYTKRPNIVVIMADDMGFSDIGCFGGEIPTPNLDKLAKNGLRLNQFYNTGRCCPTRASLLTGLYPHQAGVGFMTGSMDNNPAYQGYINNTSGTVGEVMKSNGYFTAMTGKWHVGHKEGMRPTDRGFDKSLNAAAGGFYFSEDPKAQLFLDGKPVSENDKLPKNWYSTDLWTEYSLKFIDEAKKENKPFFLYLAHNAPHFPLQVPEDEIQKFRGKYSKDWETIRKARYEKQIKMGVINKKYPLTPINPLIPDWNSLSPLKQKQYDDMMAIYAAVVSRLDKSIGDLIEGLKSRNQLSNTVIFFFSDNGGNAEPGIEGIYKGIQPGAINSVVHIGQPWAAVNNTPFWLYKHHTSEGGIASPFIISWENGLPTNLKGKINNTAAHVIDILPTCLSLAKMKYPEKYKQNSITPFEGQSLVPLINGESMSRSQPIFWEHEGNRAMRDDKWKIVSNLNEQWQLYNLENDRTELKDLSGEYPEKLNELINVYEKWYIKVGAKPYFDKPKPWQYSILKVVEKSKGK